MAQFFQDFEEESVETAKKAKEIMQESRVKESKNEKKIKGFTLKMDELRKGTKGFEKNVKKLFQELNKYLEFVRTNMMKQVKDFCLDEKIMGNKQTGKLSREFLERLEEDEEKSIIGIGMEKKRNMSEKDVSKLNKKLNEIMKNRSENERLKSLEVLMEDSKIAEERNMVRISILFTVQSMGNNKLFLDILTRFINDKDFGNDDEYGKLLRENIPFYIEKINGSIVNGMYDAYLELLKSAKKYCHIYVERKILEFKFLELNGTEETDDEYFRLLFLVRKKEWSLSNDYYRKNKNIFLGENAKSDGHIVSRILIEFGELALEKKEYLLGLECFEKIDELKYYDVKAVLYSICVLAREKLKEKKILQEFIDVFSTLKENPLLLESSDPVEEVLRAFYYMEIGEKEIGGKILQDVLGISIDIHA